MDIYGPPSRGGEVWHCPSAMPYSGLTCKEEGLVVRSHPVEVSPAILLQVPMKDISDNITTSSDAQRPSSAEMEVAVRAYELWQLAGEPSGRDLEYWFIAEGELRSEKQPGPAWEEDARKQAMPEVLGE